MSNALSDLLSQREELARQQASLEKQIADAKRAGRADAIRQIQLLMDAHGLTVRDLSAAPKGSGSGQKLAPKYRDPVTGSTWAGRGVKPAWFKAGIAAGKKPEDFAIAAGK